MRTAAKAVGGPKLTAAPIVDSSGGHKTLGTGAILHCFVACVLAALLTSLCAALKVVEQGTSDLVERVCCACVLTNVTSLCSGHEGRRSCSTAARRCRRRRCCSARRRRRRRACTTTTSTASRGSCTSTARSQSQARPNRFRRDVLVAAAAGMKYQLSLQSSIHPCMHRVASMLLRLA